MDKWRSNGPIWARPAHWNWILFQTNIKLGPHGLAVGASLLLNERSGQDESQWGASGQRGWPVAVRSRPVGLEMFGLAASWLAQRSQLGQSWLRVTWAILT